MTRGAYRLCSSTKAPSSPCCTRSISRTSGSSPHFSRGGERRGVQVAAGMFNSWRTNHTFSGPGGGNPVRPHRQLDPERAALAFPALDADLAAHQLHVLLDDGQAQPGVQAVAVARRVGAVEALEDVLARLLRDADARVADFQP